MSKILAITGKGGVGKSTIAANLALSMLQYGVTPILVDANLASPTIAWQFGTTKVPFGLQHVLKKQCSPEQALYKHSSGLLIMPASVSVHHKDATLDELPRILEFAKKHATMVIVDAPAGLCADTKNILKHADDVLLVTTQEFPTMLDALRTRSMHSQTRIVVNRATSQVNGVSLFLRAPLLGVVPEDTAVHDAMRLAQPVVFSHPESKISHAFGLLAQNFLYQKCSPQKL